MHVFMTDIVGNSGIIVFLSLSYGLWLKVCIAMVLITRYANGADKKLFILYLYKCRRFI